MAGMLPGVECARRRRFHQSGGSSDSPSTAAIGLTRRSSFCLYTSNLETHHGSVSSQQRSILYQDEKLGGVAREAKERLDERLRSQRKSSGPKRQHSGKDVSLKNVEGRCMIQGGELHTEVFGSSKKSSSGSSGSSKRFSWAKLSWKASDQNECAICLEGFKAGETLVHPPCAHRFHSRCLVPWLENNARCPCCRIGILLS